MEECLSCQQEFPRQRLALIGPWEDGNNSCAYWRCPNCGYENIVDGMGDDD
jgi:predicted RNA-binding Zn-ribbon protein involved in translation (DUF1610 family)